MLSALESFLDKRSSGSELGLRLRGQELAAGVRFLRINRQASYDVVVANPPYQGTSKLRDAKWYKRNYPQATTDLFAGMTLRALELLRPSGTCAMIALSNWMYIKSFVEFRTHVLTHHLTGIADLGKAAFSTGGTLISTACYVVRNHVDQSLPAVAIRPMSPTEVIRDSIQPLRCSAALRIQRGRYEFSPASLRVVPEWPLVYWWDEKFLKRYDSAPKFSPDLEVRGGMHTSNNNRFVRRPWEIAVSHIKDKEFSPETESEFRFVPYIMGAAGDMWIAPFANVILWERCGIQSRVAYEAFGSKGGGNGTPSRSFYFRRGVAYTSIGSKFSAGAHREPGIIYVAGSSVFPDDIAHITCLLNSRIAREVLLSLNPTVNFQVGDVNRMAQFPIDASERIFKQIESSYSLHESRTETSIEFKQPGPTPWRYAQEWAQAAVDRDQDEPLPEYTDEFDSELPTDHMSFAFGAAIGRFHFDGKGVTIPENDVLDDALPAGILFLDGTLDEEQWDDSLGHPAAKPIRSKWEEVGVDIESRKSIREWLRLSFFKDIHKPMYENRPIYWPLSSAGKRFVAYVNIHRFNDQTLRVLLADHLGPTLTRLDGELEDLVAARQSSGKSSSSDAEQRYADVKKWQNELSEFIAKVQHCADKGPTQVDSKKQEREVDSPFDPQLDDGVMVNSAALWSLLEPQWKDPKKWWKELVATKGKKDYDWSHLSMRYFPTRVDKKCQANPSLAVTHGCFWKYHPSSAWRWELRLQFEIGPNFRVEEGPYRDSEGHETLRASYLRDNAEEALATLDKEIIRRLKNVELSLIHI